MEPRYAPIVKYTNLVLLEMYRESRTSLVLRKSEPMPVVTIVADPDLGLADFAHVVNRLKVMAKFDPVQYKRPVGGRIMLNVKGDPVDVYVHFDDRSADPYCEITMKRESS